MDHQVLTGFHRRFYPLHILDMVIFFLSQLLSGKKNTWDTCFIVMFERSSSHRNHKNSTVFLEIKELERDKNKSTRVRMHTQSKKNVFLWFWFSTISKSVRAQNLYNNVPLISIFLRDFVKIQSYLQFLLYIQCFWDVWLSLTLHRLSRENLRINLFNGDPRLCTQIWAISWPHSTAHIS